MRRSEVGYKDMRGKMRLVSEISNSGEITDKETLMRKMRRRCLRGTETISKESETLRQSMPWNIK